MQELIELIQKNIRLNSFSFENTEIKHMQEIFKSFNNIKLENLSDFEKSNYQEAKILVNNLVPFIRDNKIETILLFLFSIHSINTYINVDTTYENVISKEPLMNLFINDFTKIFLIFEKQIKKEIQAIKTLLTLNVLNSRENEVNYLFQFITIDLFNIYKSNNIFLNSDTNDFKQSIFNLETIIYNDLKYFKSKIV